MTMHACRHESVAVHTFECRNCWNPLGSSSVSDNLFLAMKGFDSKFEGRAEWTLRCVQGFSVAFRCIPGVSQALCG